MTNPNDAVGTNAAYAGRTSVNAFNDDLASYTRGVLSGWECQVSSGLTVECGGDGSTRDVAIAEDNSGNKTSINNISGSPIQVTLDAAPGSNSRIDLVVAYVDNPPQGVSTVADNPSSCGIINVTGTASSTPVAPDDNAIRAAITSDGASGTTAYYTVLAQITVQNGTTDLDPNDIQQGDKALDLSELPNNSVVYNKLKTTTLPGKVNAMVTISDNLNTGSSWKDFGTYTIPSTGLYMSRIFIDADAISTNHNSQARLLKGSTEIQAIQEWPSEAWSGNYFCRGSDTWVFWFNQGDVLTLQGKNNNATVGLSIRLNLQKIY